MPAARALRRGTLLALCVLVALAAVPVAPGLASWSSAGTLTTSRERHTATLLPGGKVLVAGGWFHHPEPEHRTALASAELYDPATRSWSEVESMAAARDDHAAVLLPNGKVLVAGGWFSGGASAELYDPKSGSWTAAGTLAHGDYDHPTTTLLPDGKVLLVGAVETETSPGGEWEVTGTRAELYDPETNSWSDAGRLIDPREGGFTATRLPDGRVLVAGGYVNDYESSEGYAYLHDDAEAYDPDTNAWTEVAAMQVPRHNHTATLLPDGRVLMAGNGTFDGPPSELYDPTTNAWSDGGSGANRRFRHSATLLPSGDVLVAGGYGGDEDGFVEPVATTERYSPPTGTWSRASAMSVARLQHTATLLPDGTVLVAGGDFRDGLSTAEVYDPSAEPGPEPEPSPADPEPAPPAPGPPTAPPGSPAPVGDSTAPRAGLAAGSQSLRSVLRKGLRLRVELSEPGRACVALRLRRRGTGKALRIARRCVTLAAAGERTLTLPLRRRGKRALRRAARAAKPVSIRARVVATDEAGNRGTSTGVIRLSRRGLSGTLMRTAPRRSARLPPAL